jgi:hypothetical protein
MDVSARYRLGLWAILVLVILNVGLLGLVWFEHFNRTQQPAESRSNPEDYFIKELQLDQQQADSVRVLRREHFARTDSIKARIVELSVQMAKELFAPAPDSSRMRNLSDQIGQQQAEFERQVYAHFNDVKKLLHQDQYGKLQDLIVGALQKKQPSSNNREVGHQQLPEEQGTDNRTDRRAPPRDDRRPPPRDDQKPRPPNDDRQPDGR